MLFGRLGILMAADIVNIFILSWQYFYFQYRLTFMRPTINKLLPMCVCVRVCLCFALLPKLWQHAENLFFLMGDSLFSLPFVGLWLLQGKYFVSLLSIVLANFSFGCWLRASNFRRAMRRFLCYIHNLYVFFVYANFRCFLSTCTTVPHLFNGILFFIS